MATYKYGMRLRGFSIGCQPKQGFLERGEDDTGKYYDVLVYDRLLSDDELRQYELDYLGAARRLIFIEGTRSGYGPEQCGRTFTAGELAEFFSQFDEDTPVYLRNDNGYTYGEINERTVEACDFEEEK